LGLAGGDHEIRWGRNALRQAAQIDPDRRVELCDAFDLHGQRGFATDRDTQQFGGLQAKAGLCGRDTQPIDGIRLIPRRGTVGYDDLIVPIRGEGEPAFGIGAAGRVVETQHFRSGWVQHRDRDIQR